MISTLFALYILLFNGSQGYFHYYYTPNYSEISLSLEQFHFTDSGAAAELLRPFLPLSGENFSLSSGFVEFGLTAIPQGKVHLTYDGHLYQGERMSIYLTFGNSTFSGYAYVFQTGLIYNLTAGPFQMRLTDTNYQLNPQVYLSPIPFYVAGSFVGGAVIAYFVSRSSKGRKAEAGGRRDSPYWVD
ncbi:hypothetical protein HS1genome_0723 [Sulfodiicoccus acidiphilus]|uniref:Uncharacterized protein n=1 Tax=Sulfodiicoccus acidiphilus TaxID=1670455 RepID=A0A348B2D2_9CREN|nr:hypothetical protein [Sulfodiicoccus acidiphilus]BBD72334.1 hypothetical protein HS1genome_0723 [Sulfodiicoccus acidiphilus]GGT90202.1 hypothetical protein GCM10007116_04980 [Sulfodiicoccus acidiphilus]